MTEKYQPNFHVVLYSPEIPQNTGAIGRTCVAMQAKLWLIRPLGFRMDEKTLRRAGLDYWEHLVWEIADHWEDFNSRCPAGDRWYFSRFATQGFRSASFKLGDILIFGSETSGLPKKMIDENVARLFRIPMRPEVRSLNLAASVAIAGYEVQRQLIENGEIGNDI